MSIFCKSKTPYNKDVILHLLFKKSILKKIRELYRNEKAYRSITINIYNRIYRSVPIKYIVYFVIYICRCSMVHHNRRNFIRYFYRK